MVACRGFKPHPTLSYRHPLLPPHPRPPAWPSSQRATQGNNWLQSSPRQQEADNRLVRQLNLKLLCAALPTIPRVHFSSISAQRTDSFFCIVRYQPSAFSSWEKSFLPPSTDILDLNSNCHIYSTSFSKAASLALFTLPAS